MYILLYIINSHIKTNRSELFNKSKYSNLQLQLKAHNETVTVL